MYFIYTSALALGLALALPYYLVRFRKYAPTLGERMGWIPEEPGPGAVWIHAVSVGEVKAVDRLIGIIAERFRGKRIVVSTTTPTGRELALGRRDVDRVVYFPLDLPRSVARSLSRIRPELVIVAETEIWPNFLRRCRELHIPVFMINGRISDRSFSRYRLARRWLGRVLRDYRLLGMQSEMDAGRIRALGAPPERVVVLGNLKYDMPSATAPLDEPLSRRLAGLKPLLAAASTAAGEEPLVLDAYAQIRRTHPALKLLIAPRLADRFDEVERILAASGVAYARRSWIPLAPDTTDVTTDVLLLDSIGELTAVFEHADVVFMGGTLVPRGGHNILEPARFSKPVVFGPHMENFREMARTFLDARAAMQVADAGELAAVAGLLLNAPEAAREMGQRARAVVRANAGATERAVAVIEAAVAGAAARRGARA